MTNRDNKTIITAWVIFCLVFAGILLWKYFDRKEPKVSLPVEQSSLFRSTFGGDPPPDLDFLFADGFGDSEVIPPPVCPELPSGWREYRKSWGQVFGKKNGNTFVTPAIQYPNSPSWLQPVGQYTLNLSSSARIDGRIIVVPFVADGVNHRVSWVNAQPVPAINYGGGNAATKGTVSISSCPADLYSPCSYTANSTNLFYGPTASDPDCQIVPGQTYYLQFHFARPNLDPNTNWCNTQNFSGGNKCDINVVHN